MFIARASMEITYFTLLPKLTFVFGQLESSCAEPSWWQYLIIIGLIAASGLAIASTGVGLVGIANILITMIVTGANIESIAVALAPYLAVATGSMGVLSNLINAIKGVLGC